MTKHFRRLVKQGNKLMKKYGITIKYPKPIIIKNVFKVK